MKIKATFPKLPLRNLSGEVLRLSVDGAAFVAGDLTKVVRFINAPQRFDVVVACEVLYYIEDVPRALKQISDLGRHCLVTYYSSHREKLDQELAGIHFAGRETIRCDDHSWSVVWWRNY